MKELEFDIKFTIHREHYNSLFGTDAGGTIIMVRARGKGFSYRGKMVVLDHDQSYCEINLIEERESKMVANMAETIYYQKLVDKEKEQENG